MTSDPVRNRELSPVRPHRENGSGRRREAACPRTHSPYDYNEVF